MKFVVFFILVVFATESYGTFLACQTALGVCMDRRKHCCPTGFTDDYSCPGSVHNKCCLAGDICHPGHRHRTPCKRYGGVCRPRGVPCSVDVVEGLCESDHLGCCFPETECERKGGRCVHVNVTNHRCPKPLEPGMCLDSTYGCCIHTACSKLLHDLACSALSGSTTFHGHLPSQQSRYSAYQNVVDACFGTRARTDPSCPKERVCLHPGLLQLVECLEGICGTLKVKWITGGCDLDDCFSHCKGNAIAFLFPEDCDPDAEVDVQLLYDMCGDLGGRGTTNQHGYITCTFNEEEH